MTKDRLPHPTNLLMMWMYQVHGWSSLYSVSVMANISKVSLSIAHALNLFLLLAAS